MSEYILKVPEYKPPYDPAVQAASLGEEIVRCKDCEYMKRQTTYDGSMSWLLCSHFKRPTRLDGFCAWSDRRQ